MIPFDPDPNALKLRQRAPAAPGCESAEDDWPASGATGTPLSPAPRPAAPDPQTPSTPRSSAPPDQIARSTLTSAFPTGRRSPGDRHRSSQGVPTRKYVSAFRTHDGRGPGSGNPPACERRHASPQRRPSRRSRTRRACGLRAAELRPFRRRLHPRPSQFPDHHGQPRRRELAPHIADEIHQIGLVGGHCGLRFNTVVPTVIPDKARQLAGRPTNSETPGKPGPSPPESGKS